MPSSFGLSSSRRASLQHDAQKQLADHAAALKQDLVRAAAVTSPIVIDPQRLHELQQALSLLAAEVPARASPAARRLPIAALLLVSALVVAVLMFTRLESVEVFASVRASGFSATVAEAHTLTGPVRVGSLTVSKFDDLRAPFLDHLLPPAASVAARTLTLEPAAGCEGSMTVELPGLSPGDTVGLQFVGARRLRLTRSARGPGVAATLTGCWQVLRAGAAPTTIQLKTPQRLTTTASDAGLDLVINPLSPEHAWLNTPLRLASLDFHRLDQHDTGSSTLVRQVSTLTSGSVQFEALGGRVTKLRPGEALRWSALSGELIDLRSTEGAFDLAFQGDVQGLRTGSKRHPRDLMPTWLDWLRENQAASLYWAAVISAFGLLGALRRWWTT